ncbi:MAG: putative PurR-regulated permease PerM, partial [Candidatus Paceibacteria bacterium]
MTQSQIWLFMVVGLMVAGVLYLLQPVLTPFLVGIGIAYVADPFADRLEAKGFSRTMATVIVFSVLTLLLVVMMLGLLPLLMTQIQTLAQILPNIEIWYNASLLPWLQSSLGLDIKSMQ